MTDYLQFAEQQTLNSYNIDKSIFEIYCTPAIGVARIFNWGGPNHKSHAMTSSESSKEEFFGGAKIS